MRIEVPLQLYIFFLLNIDIGICCLSSREDRAEPHFVNIKFKRLHRPENKNIRQLKKISEENYDV